MRRVRLRRNERQADVARRAGISRATYSRIERGHLVNMRHVRAAANALEMRAEVIVYWRGGDLERLLRARHSAMSEAVARMLRADGWEVHPEVSFNQFGERGVIDIVGWHTGWRSMLIIELKTELVDVGELLATMDRRRRLAPRVAQERGWRPDRIGAWIVLAESRTNRRHVARHREVIRSAYPEGGHAVRGWLAKPDRVHAALWFLPDDHTATLGRRTAPLKRVSRARSVAAVRPAPDK